MSKQILLAKNFPLPVAAITESIAVMGRKGGGKTYTGGRLFEQMHSVGCQCVALDPVGNWWGLRLSASGKRRGLDIPVFGGDHGDIPITPESGKLMAEVVVTRRISCVIDLMLFKKGQRKKFVTDFAEELFHLKKKHRSPLHMFLEEARKFIPQKLFGPDDARMVGAFEDIVRLGRNYGLGSTMLDQRPQSVNKEVLSQVEIFIVHQLTEKHGRKEIEDWVRAKDVEGADQLKEIAKLEKGHAFIWSPGLLRKFDKVKVGKKSTYDASRTPELGDDIEEVETRPLSDQDLAKLQTSMAEVVEQAAAKDPTRLRKMLKNALASVKRLERELENRPEAVDKEIYVPVFTEAEYRELTDKIGELGKNIGAELGGIQQQLMVLRDFGENKKPVKSQGRPTRKGSNGVKRLNKPTRGSKPPAVKRETDVELTGPEQRIIDAAAWLEGIGVEKPEVNAVAFLAGYKPGGGAFNNPKGRLRAKGLLEYAPGKRVFLTPEGRGAANPPDEVLDNDALHALVLAKLGGPEKRILQPLLDAYPDPMDRADLAEAAGYSGGGGAFNNPKGRLRTLGLIDYPEPGMVQACDILFLD
jgi:hypothetical protein